MPRGDGTGPMGAGPMTGRAAGFCAGYGVPGYINPAPGQGYGRGNGRGYGRGRGFGRAMGYRAAYGGNPAWGNYPAPVSAALAPESEEKYIREEIGCLEEDIKNLKSRLKEVSTDKKK